ncbi:MAG: ATP synthase F0 subunit B [Nitrospirota bacterium]
MKKVQNPKLKIQNKKNFLLFLFCILTLAFASLAFCAGEEEAAHTPLWREYLWKIINFAVLVIILFKFAKKPFQSFLRQRTELIQKTLDEAREAKELALKALKEVEDRLKEKDKEIEEIMSVAKVSGEKELENLMMQGDKLKAYILEQAKANIDLEVKKAKEDIKAEAVEIAMELAEKKIKEKLTKKEQEKLLEESIAKMGGSS